ncbi:MAG TPA: asparagine--tRNA ligase [Candidatus Bathyarchaeia archaeon]|jgi:asparaginyl-tRNA synthetase|nr:asparagine--tRNA ligase [Candidatus Bathyarchaeia archaeon]
MSFIPITEILQGRYEGKKVAIRGWVYRKREGKQTIFLVMRDSTGVIQCTIKAESPAWGDAEKLTIESSISLEGSVKQDKRAPGGYELSVDNVSVIGLAELFPIAKDKSEEFLRDVRHLWLRSRRMNLVMKVRSKIQRFTDEFFEKQGFVEVSPPMFVTSAVEGGSTLFSLKYFDQNMYLTQSSQLYLEVLIYSLEKVYCVAPSFRAEKSRTIRHLTEYWHIEAEQAFADMADLMRLEEELLAYICRRVAEECKSEFAELGADISKLALVKTPFPRITYTEGIERLKAKGFKTRWGEDLGYEEEKALADEFGKPFFVYDYPKGIKAFYCKIRDDDPRLALSTDMLVPRIGEISTGGAREDDKEKLVERIKEQGSKVEDYDWYLDLRKYGTVPHVGFGMGLERLVTWMLDLENIIDAIPFPRTTRRFYP